MKTVNIQLAHPIAFLLLFTLWFYNCRQKVVPEQKAKQEKVVKVFEIKYHETVSFAVDSVDFIIKPVAVKDSVYVNCSLVSPKTNSNGEEFKKIRVYADLQTTVNNKTQTYRVQSKICGADGFINDGTDLVRVIQAVNDIKKFGSGKERYATFKDIFIDGTKICYPYKIYMMKAYPMKYYKKKYTDADYKFIFAITTI